VELNDLRPGVSPCSDSSEMDVTELAQEWHGSSRIFKGQVRSFKLGVGKYGHLHISSSAEAHCLW